MEIPAEMSVFEAEVGGDQDFVTGRGAEDGAVVADSQCDRRVAGCS
jgi:hypothetical protein